MTEMSDNKNNNSHSKEHVTFRIQSSLRAKLREMANREKISLNSLVEHVLDSYVNWHSLAVQAGEMHISKMTVSKITEACKLADLLKIAKFIGTKNLPEIITMLKGNYNIETWLDGLEMWLSVSGFAYKHEVNGNMHSFVIQFNMGKNFSLFMSEVYKNAFMRLDCKTEFSPSDNTVTFTVDVNTANKKK